MRRWTTLLVVGMLTLATLLAAGGAADAQSEEDRLDQIEAEIASLERQIASAESSRQETATLLQETHARLDEVRAQLTQAQGALDSILAAIDVQEAAIAELERQIGVLEAALAQTQLEQLTTRQQLRDRAVDLYMNGSYSVGRVVFAVSDATNASVGVAYAENLLDNTSFLLRSLEALENQEQAQRAGLRDRRSEEQVALGVLEDDRREAEEHRAAVDAIRAEVADELASHEALLASINSEIAQLDGHIGSLAAEAAQIEAEIAARQQQGGTNPGLLAWPVPGPITSPFGYRIHPITGTSRLHAGIDLNGSSGQSIRAAGGGTVILAEWYGGYGNTVVIDHGGGLSTLYAHQSGLNVSRGSTVSAGDVVGFVGSTGFSTGSHLHFETREFGTPVDPMRYLGG
ncbi:MAG: peptidoglycan DD-metalloendopeptidase family protein [Acidimicrobiia bacterium]|nr:peptidoglycan DD-metalloendopeptidase family protein [Acidimicrobiia bacterium]